MLMNELRGGEWKVEILLHVESSRCVGVRFLIDLLRGNLRFCNDYVIS